MTFPEDINFKAPALPSKLYQRRRSSLQYCYRYTRRPSLPRHSIYMYPIDTDIQSPGPLLRNHSSSPNTCSPLTPNLGPIDTTTPIMDSPSDTSSPFSTQSQLLRTMLLPKSPSSPTFWKRQHSLPLPINNNNNNNKRLRVLLVDDNQVNLQVLAKALKLHMADIFQHMDMASSGEDAIEKLRQQFYDMILMDIDMPGLNGIDAASWIRRGHQQQQEQQQQQLAFVLTQNRYIPIVAVTTNMSMEWKKAYLKVGMNGCLPKPISPFVLRESLTQVLTYGSCWDYSPS